MKQIIFFDGVCNLCNFFVDFVITRDKHQFFYFSSLQGAKAKSVLAPSKTDQLDTVILYQEGKTWEKSDAALRILQQLGGAWVLTRIFWIFPKCIRDIAYNFIARNRYTFFGKKEQCRLPTPSERARFLD